MFQPKLRYQLHRFAIFLILILFLIPHSAIGASEASRIILGTHYDVFHDSSNKVTVEDLIDGAYDQHFTPSSQKYPFFWHTTDTIWLRLPLNELIQGNTNGYVIEGIDKQDSVSVYFVREDGSYTLQKGGIEGLESQSIRYRSSLFTVEDPNVTEVYVALSGELPLMFSSILHTNNSFIESVITYKFSTGIFYGFVFALMLYNLFLFFSLKEKAYIFYVFYMFSFMAYQAAMNSLDLELLGHALPEWLLFRTLPISCTILVGFMILFGKEFLELKTHLPKHNRGLNLFLWITIFSLLSVFTVPDLEAVNNAITLLTVIVSAFLWVSGLTMLLKGFKMARFYMVGWTALLGTMLIQGFGFLGWIPFHPSLYEIVPAIAVCFEAIFLSLALGDKINLMKKEMNDKLEEKVQQRTKQLEEANQTLEEMQDTRAKLLAFIAHDLGSPIQSLQMYLQLIKNGMLEIVDERTLDELNEKSSYMNRLVHDLFELSKLELKEASFQKEEVPTKEFTQHIFKQFEYDLKQKNMHLHIEKLETTINNQETFFIIDKIRITQVIQNLLDNAVKFSKEINNTITLNCYCIDSNEIRFEVTDYGSGIEIDDISRVFDGFYKRKEHNENGSGLGLTISKQIIEQHQGRIGVTSKKGQGSTFYFHLPLVKHY